MNQLNSKISTDCEIHRMPISYVTTLFKSQNIHASKDIKEAIKRGIDKICYNHEIQRSATFNNKKCYTSIISWVDGGITSQEYKLPIAKLVLDDNKNIIHLHDLRINSHQYDFCTEPTLTVNFSNPDTILDNICTALRIN